MSTKRPGRRAVILATLFAVALVILPFLFWYDTWFGRRLGDKQLEEYLASDSKPRRKQQALVQIGERLSQGDTSVSRLYPRVIEASRHGSEELRQTAAWIMGQDRTSGAFRDRLREMLRDGSPMVRRNAALALTSHNDPSGRPVLGEMLLPAVVVSPADGALKYRLKPGDYANPGTLLARVGETEVRASLPGEVAELSLADGTQVRKGQKLLELAPDETHVWEALRALHVVGTNDDLELISRYTRSASTKIQQQAALTVRQIETRKQAAPDQPAR
jgi:hypothetical protein